MRKGRVKMNMYYNFLEFGSKFLYYCIVKYMKIYIFFKKKLEFIFCDIF